MRLPVERPARGFSGPPDFIGVGAEGSGTRWWHSLLLAHPEIVPPLGRRRALGFFTEFGAIEFAADDVATYHGHFPRRDGKLTGEWSDRYVFDAWTPPLLRRVAPDAKLLLVLSDPIEYYRSVLAERLARYESPNQFNMADAVDRRSHGAQLARLHRFYDPAQILVLQLERCRLDVPGQYHRTLEFLGTRDTSFVPRDQIPGPMAIAAAAFRRIGARAVARRLTGRRRSGPTVRERAPAPLWPDIEASLHTALDADVKLLKSLAPDLDLTLWLNFAHLADATAAA